MTDQRGVNCIEIHISFKLEANLRICHIWNLVDYNEYQQLNKRDFTLEKQKLRNIV